MSGNEWGVINLCTGVLTHVSGVLIVCNWLLGYHLNLRLLIQVTSWALICFLTVPTGSTIVPGLQNSLFLIHPVMFFY